jgi:hypothetical protein
MLSLEGKLALGGLAALAVWFYVILPSWYGPPQSFPWHVLAAVAAAASAAFSAVSGWAASRSAQANIYNTRAYERQLRNTTIDACVSAAIGLRGAINRALRIKVESADNYVTPDLWAAYTEAWSRCVVFEQTFTIVKRYVSAGFHPNEPDKSLADLLTELRPEFRTVNWALAEDKEFIFQERVKAIVDDTVSKLRSVPVAD